MKYIFAIIVALLCCPATVFAQADSTKVQYSEENVASSDFNLKETYNYLIRAQVEEKTLLKIGVNGYNFGGSGSQLDYASLTYGVGLEQKIKPSFSVLGEFRHTLSSGNPWVENPKFALNLGARYYYNIESRIRKGKSANNFSANYLAIFQQNMLAKLNDVQLRENGKYYYYTQVNFLYGMQRRIGKYGYVDFGFGPVYKHYPANKQSSQKNIISINVLFSIGLAF